MWAVIDFAAWCSASRRNQEGSNSNKPGAIQYSHWVDWCRAVDPVAVDEECIPRYLAIAHIGGHTPTVRLPIS